jgi:triacylglycerol lipase
MIPVLLVHGIWDSAARLDPLKSGLEQRGVPVVRAMNLVPSDGRASIRELADLVASEARAFAAEQKAERIDLVGFSMGALVSRVFLHRCGGKERVRRFVSISGPHHGTWSAFALPLRGVRDMRPRSALLRDLEDDRDPFGAVDVHCVYTPFDLMILPPKSSVLPTARSVRAIPIPMHRFMISDARVLDHVASILRA